MRFDDRKALKSQLISKIDTILWNTKKLRLQNNQFIEMMSWSLCDLDSLYNEMKCELEQSTNQVKP